MPFYDDAARNAALDSLWGSAHGTSMPTSFQVGLFEGDPGDGGHELASDGGYARVTVPNNGSTWLPAEGGVKTSNPVTFPDPTGAWSGDATFWGIFVGGALFDYGRLAQTISVAAASPGPQITLTRYFDTLT